MKSVKLAAIAAVVVPCVAHATDILPLQGVEIAFGTTSVLTYYVPAADGFHLVATMNHVNGDPASVFRFIAVLANGQQVVMSMPRAVGEASEEVTFRRDGDRLMLLEPEELTAGK